MVDTWILVSREPQLAGWDAFNWQCSTLWSGVDTSPFLLAYCAMGWILFPIFQIGIEDVTIAVPDRQEPQWTMARPQGALVASGWSHWQTWCVNVQPKKGTVFQAKFVGLIYIYIYIYYSIGVLYSCMGGSWIFGSPQAGFQYWNGLTWSNLDDLGVLPVKEPPQYVYIYIYVCISTY